jgi:hypothetical protein
MSAATETVATFLADNRELHAKQQVERMRTEVPEYFASSGPAVLSLAVESTADWQLGISAALAGTQILPQPPPALALREAVVTARMGIPWRAVEKTIWVGQRETVNAIFALVREQNLPREAERGLLQEAIQTVSTYCGELTTMLAHVHEVERDRCVRRGEHRRIDTIRAVLAGTDVSDHSLGYSLSDDHVAATAWGPAAEESLQELAERIGVALLLTPGGGGGIWAWLGSAPGARALDSCSDFAPPVGTQIALGTRRAGRLGFVDSHNEACEAERVGRLSGASMTLYSEVAAEAFALRDKRLARAFVHRELGELAAFTDRSVRLRETLATYFMVGNNGSAAAAILGVHERTVSYRLNQIEELLGRRVFTRREEIMVALRLHVLLSGE